MRRIGALVAVVAVVTALAAAASAGAADRPSLADDVAARLGISPEKLREAFRDALAARIDAAVKAGKLTPEQAAKLKDRLEHARGLGLAIRKGLARHRHAFVPRPRAHLPGFHARLHGLAAAAKYLGLTPRELRAELRDGKSLAQIATDHGKSVDGLVDALLERAKKRLDAAVDRGRLTRERADAILERLENGVEKLVQHTRPAPR